MNTEAIIAVLDDEIQRLTSARNLLNGIEGMDRGTNMAHSAITTTSTQRRPYRRSATKAPAVKGSASKKRAMTPEGRKRIAEAMKARWAAKRSTVKAIKSVNK